MASRGISRKVYIVRKRFFAILILKRLVQSDIIEANRKPARAGKGGAAMPAITEQELKKQISAGALAPVYLLDGEEKLLVKRAAQRLIAKAAGDAFPEFNRNEFTNDSNVEGIAEAVVALPFFAEHKCVAVADFNPEDKRQEDLDRLFGVLEDPPETCTLVLYYPTLQAGGQKSAKWRKLLEKVRKAGHTVDFPRLEAPELRRVLARDAEKQGCVLPRPSLERLLSYAGDDLNLLRREVEKLCAYALGLGQTEVTPGMVEELTPKSTETTVFMMVNALVAGNYEKAYGLLDSLFYQNEEPVAILGAMAASYLDMYRVKAALESGLTSAAPAEYCPDYKNRGFRLRNAERNARGISSRTLKQCLDLLLDADLSLKGSKLEPRLVLEGLVSRLLAAREGQA